METNINFYINSQKLISVLKKIPPLEGFTHEFHYGGDIKTEGINIIITNDAKKLPERINKSAKYILCTKNALTLNDSQLEKIYAIWPLPFNISLLRFYFIKLLKSVKRETVVIERGHEQEEYQKRIIEMAHQDYLTGLATRWYLQEYVKNNEHEENITCIYFDLDRFKNVNDTYGHQAGDRALAATAEMMQTEFTDGFCARMGGDEFMIVLAGERDITEVERKVNDFMKKLLAYYATTKTMKQLSVSAGISQRLKGQEKSIDRLIHESDSALYHAKKAGRACCRIYDSSMEEANDKEPEQTLNYYLVDYENVKNHGFAGIEEMTEHDDICIFYSDNAQGSFTVELLQKMNDSKASITYIKAAVGTRNALDFQLAAYLGELISGHKDGCRYFIVSNDRGYESLISYGRNKNVNVKVIPNLAEGIAANEELKRKVSEALPDMNETDVIAIANILSRWQSKRKINGEIVKYMKDSQKAGEIYRRIKSLIPRA